METYILSTPDRFHAWRKALDFKAVITSREWLMYSDHGSSEKYIFRKDGSVVRTINGKGLDGLKWEYISQNGALLITLDNCQYMYKPIYYDEAVFAFSLDDTNQYLILLDQPKMQSLNFSSKEKLNLYISNRRQYDKEERQEKEERKRAWKGEIDKLMDDYKKSEEWVALCNNYKVKRKYTFLFLFVMSTIAFASFGMFIYDILNNCQASNEDSILWSIFILCFICICFSIYYLSSISPQATLIDKREEIEWNHPFPG